jgi:uncharacterized membrane protein
LYFRERNGTETASSLGEFWFSKRSSFIWTLLSDDNIFYSNLCVLYWTFIIPFRSANYKIQVAPLVFVWTIYI